MRELTLQVEDGKYHQFVQFLTTIDYIKILTQLQQTNTADTEKKVSAKVVKQKKTATPLSAAENSNIEMLRADIKKKEREVKKRLTTEVGSLEAWQIDMLNHVQQGTESKKTKDESATKPKFSTLRKSIVSPQSEQSILKQIKDSKDEWERNI